jgi:hypothetical protein
MTSNVEDLPRQANVVPDQIFGAPTPSLWLYTFLAILGAAMLAIALHGKATTADILVNLGTGLLEAVAILIFIDRRLRRTDVQAIRGIPRSIGLSLFLLRPSERQIYKYTRAYLKRVLPQLKDTAPRPELEKHASLIDKGFVLLGKSRFGKTTWLQSVVAERAKRFITSPQACRAPILFPLTSWLQDRTLEEALCEHMSGFSPVSLRALRRGLKNQRFLIVLDGADEAFWITNQLREQVATLRQAYPNVPVTVSSNPERPTPVDGLEVVNVDPPTDEELTAFLQRVRKSG